MDFLTPLMSIIQSSCVFTAKRIGHVMNVNSRVQRMVIKLEELKDTRDDVKREVKRAELEGLMNTKQVNGWLERVGKVEAEVNLILALSTQAQQEGKCLISNVGCWSRYKLSKKALNKEREISDLLMKKAALNVLAASEWQHVDPIPNGPTLGLDATLGKALQLIGNDEVGIIGIYGMGGVGKTTLLKEINNEYLSRSHDFEMVIWVTVSRDFVLDRIQHELFSRLRLSWEEEEKQERRALKIYNFMRRIKFLLLLDDLWEGLNLGKIGIPLPDKKNKCKVIFTTRSLDVCSDMDATKNLINVEFLNEEDSWRLFCEKAGETSIMNSHIKPDAKTIVKKCGGLPLALITVGRAMANRKTEEEWKYAIEVLNNAPSELRGMEDVFTLLKISYENLDGYTLKMCFLYCALFPEDYPLEKEQLIDYWIGEGFLAEGAYEGSLYNKGHAIIGSLKVACLLETSEDETQVTMHNVVRSFALWIASDCGNSKENFLFQGSPGIEKWEQAERISLLDGEIRMLSGAPVCPKLSTLLLSWNCSLSKISNDFFQFMPALKVLDLSVTSIKEIPESIGQLVELRYLDLSRTKITTLPRELGYLSKLRHLDLQRAYLIRSIPREIITGLLNLRVLNMYYSYGGWETPDCVVEGETIFQDLQNLRYLTALGITVTKHFALKELSSFNNLLECIQYLYIKGCEGLIYLMVASVYGGGERLRRLSIYNCNTLKEIDLGSEPDTDWLPSLEVLILHTLPNLTAIWRKSVNQNCHKNLHYVSIWHCPKLKNLSWTLQLPSLEKIYVFYCEGMEEIIGENDEMEESLLFEFPQLKAISFRNLPNLRSICEVAISFPMLETIAVVDCPQLKKLPSKGCDSSNPPLVYCSREWWDNLEWADASASSALHPQFIAG